MERAVIFTGKVKDEENYQLLVNCSYIFRTYDGSEQRAALYDEISDIFASKILEQGSSLEVGIMIGHRINPVTMKPERILKLEEAYLAQLKEALQEKMISLAPKKTFPVCKYDKKGLTAFDKIN